MTPSRSVNYAVWAIWGAVTLFALHHSGWVQVFYVEGGTGIPLAFEFFTGCYGEEVLPRRADVPRVKIEMLMVPTNLVLIGLALALPWTRLRASVAAYTLFTIFVTAWFASEPRAACWAHEIANFDIHSYRLSHLEGFTLFEIISLVPRSLFLVLFFATPVKWSPVGHWTRPAPWIRSNVRRTL